MPEMDGVEATRQIHAAVPSAKILILRGQKHDPVDVCLTEAGHRGVVYVIFGNRKAETARIFPAA